MNSRTDKTYTAKVRLLLRTLPPYVASYEKAILAYSYRRDAVLSPCTKYSYLLDIKQYLQYIIDSDEAYHEFPLRELPIHAVTDHTDMSEFFDFLRNGSVPVSERYLRRKGCAIKSFYAYLLKNRSIRENPAKKLSFTYDKSRTDPKLTEEDIKGFMHDPP